MKPKICRYLIVFLYLFGFPDVVSGTLELKPDNPFVYIGDILELNCTASDAVADRIRFYRADFPIDKKFLQKVNNYTVKTNLPITEEDIHINTYLCEFDQNYGVQHLKIEYKPRPVENLTCQIYNWKSLTCAWDLGPYIHLKDIHVSVAWKHAMVYGTFIVDNTKLKFKTDFRFYSYKFTITVSHKQTGVQDVSVNQTYDMPKIEVKPAAVKKLEIMSEKNQCVTLKFEHDMYDSKLQTVVRELKIRVTYSSKWELQPWVVERLLNNDTMSVCDVHPYSKYKFDVDVLPIKHDGVWSDVNSVEYTTNPRVPGSGPISTNGSYYQEPCENGKRKVTIFIQHVPERLTHGNMKEYTAVYTPVSTGQQSTSKVPITEFAMDHFLKCSTDYLVELKATNNFGTSTNNTFLYIPKLREPMPLESKTNLLITVFKDNNASDKNVVARWIGFKTQPLYFKLFWCRSSSIRCESDMTWVEVEGDVTSKVIQSDSLSIEDVEARKYIFFISAIYKGNISTPLIFAYCIYQSWTVPKDRPQLKLDEKNPDLSLGVSWTYETCHSQSLVYIQSYNIYHCPTDVDGNCKAKYKTETVDSGINNYQLTHLKADTNYSVWMQPVSPGGLGPESEKLYGVPSANYALSESEIAGIIFGIVVFIGLLFFIITKICCRKYFDVCCKNYVIKKITVKEEGLKTDYDEIDYNNMEIKAEEQVNQKEKLGFKTQISDDSGTFSLPNSPSVRDQLPSISEEGSNNSRAMARSISEIVNEQPSGEENRNGMKLTTSHAEAESYYKFDLQKEELIKMTVNNVDTNQSSLLSAKNLLQAPRNRTESDILSKAILSATTNGTDTPYFSNDPSNQLLFPQSSVHKSSNSSSSESSNSSPTSQSTSSDNDSAPSYSHVGEVNQNSHQSVHSNDSQSELVFVRAKEEGRGDLQLSPNLLQAPRNRTESDILSKAKLSATTNGTDTLYFSNDPSNQLLFPQSSVHKSSNSSSSESSNSSPTSQSTSSDNDSAPSYSHVGEVNQNSHQSVHSNDSQSELAFVRAKEEDRGALQLSQGISKLDNASSSSNKQTSPYVFLPNNSLEPQPIQIPQHQNPNNGESHS